MTKKTTRVQIELPNVAMNRLKALKERTEATSYADVIRNSFIAYEKLIDLTEEGKKIEIIEPKSGSKETLVLLIP